MLPHITIYTTPDCQRCITVKAVFRNYGYEVTEKDVDTLASEPDEIRASAMADLQMQDGALPLVYYGDKLLPPERVEEIIKQQSSGVAG